MPCKVRFKVRFFAACFLLAAPLSSAGGQQVFKCTNSDGTILFSEGPCDSNSTVEWRMRESLNVRGTSGHAQASEGIQPLYTGERLSINYAATDVRQVMQILSGFSGRSFVVSPSVSTERFALLYRNVPWDQVLDAVLAKFNLTVETRGTHYYIAHPSERIGR